MSFRRIVLVLFLACLAGGYLWSQDRFPYQAYWRTRWATAPVVAPVVAGASAIPVRVVTLTPRAFPVLLETLGVVEPVATVTIKARVDGQLLKAWFEEGAMVHKGDRLFTLDDRTFVAQVHQAQANLAKDQAQWEKARLDLARYTDLAKRDVASKGQWETYQAAMATLTASLEADRAQLDQARLLLGFATIESPIDGLAGPLLLHPGNLIRNNDAGLVVIHQIQPIDVKFAVAEKYLAPLRQRMAQGGTQVAIRLPEGEQVVEEGILSFLNNAVDASTGTLQVKARTANRAGRLLPGQYVRVAINLFELEQSLVVPSEAIQMGQQGLFVFVVGADETASNRSVKVLAAQKGESAIAGAVQPGDRVVVDGHVRLAVGTPVVIRGTPAP
ncbi:MAG: efflux RND transporter periplasmic adaptor subunit [Magnetococcales bacterium]|nr:efflux RND transporter periplasmic adaptor subunit [Magnetococcales bacterium]